MQKSAYAGPLERVDSCCYRIPKSYRPDMRVDGLIFAAMEQFLQPVEEQELAVRAGNLDGYIDDGPHESHVFHDGREQARGHLGEECIQVGGGGPQSEVGGVFEEFVHARSIPRSSVRGQDRMFNGKVRDTNGIEACTIL